MKFHGNTDKAEQKKFVVPANYNYSKQTAISGEKLSVEIATEKLKQAGAKKVIALATSGPFHTSKLERAKQEYEKELNNINFNMEKFEKDSIKVIKNIDGTFYNKQDNIREILAKHIVSPVRFDKAIALMEEQGIEEYVEIGTGRVLTGFVKKENKEANVYYINNEENLKEYLNTLV